MPRYTDLALGAGAVLAVGLGLLALQPPSLPSGEGDDRVRVTPAPTSATASPSATASASTAPSATGAAGRPEAWVVGAGDGLVVRAPRAECDGDAPVTLTVISAGRATTREVEGLHAVGGISVSDQRTARIVGVDGSCERVGFGTTDGGRSWRALEAVPAVWSLVPGSRDQIHAPSGQVDVPCEPRAVTGLDDEVARLACTDGRLLGTVTGGEEWSILGNNDEVRTVAFASATTALALVDRADCDGISVDRSTDGGTDFEAAYCVEGRGPWGLVTNGDEVVVVGDDVVARSTDDGETWKASVFGS